MNRKLTRPAVLGSITLVAVVVAFVAVIAYVSRSDDDELDFVATPAAAPATQPAPNGPADLVDPEDRPLDRAEVDRVVAAALEIAGAGTVTEVDRSDDLGETYEVEVVTEAGEVDIALDEDLERVPNLRYDD